MLPKPTFIDVLSMGTQSLIDTIDHLELYQPQCQLGWQIKISGTLEPLKVMDERNFLW